MHFRDDLEQSLKSFEGLLKIKSAAAKIKVKESYLNESIDLEMFDLDDSLIGFFDSLKNFKITASKINFMTDPKKRHQLLIHFVGITILDIIVNDGEDHQKSDRDHRSRSIFFW